MLRNRRNELATATGDLTASTIVRLEDIQYLRTPKKPKDVTRTALYEALNTVETLPRIRAMKRQRKEGSAAKATAASKHVFARFWSWTRGVFGCA